MKNTQQIVDSLMETEMKKKRHIRNDIRQLRDKLSGMSHIVNVLKLRKLGKERFMEKKEHISGGAEEVCGRAGPSCVKFTVSRSTSGSNSRIRAADEEIVNTNKVVTNLNKYYKQLRRMLDEVQNLKFLINLKKETKQEIQSQNKNIFI